MVSEDAEGKTLNRLKALLLTPEKEQIRALENRLDDPMVRAKEISRFLPEAVSLSVLENDHLSRVLQPVIDASLKASVKKDPRTVADAISPALGPGIRKSISSTLTGMIQSLNQMLNHSFSIQGMKWRFEAFRTRKQFAEIVLLHTLVFQVEQIFLIHKESGIVLDHVVAKGVLIQDPDLVSGMLTAIQDFVRDSFDTREDLETLGMGSDRSVWIEKGEHALIAAVIRGTPPIDLRLKYRELIEEIHIKSGSAMENFDGDPLPFSIFREQLTDGLRFQEKTGQKKSSPLLWCALLGVLSFLGFWGFHAFEAHQTWQHYLNRLGAQKGLIILSAGRQNGEYHISGFRDPLAQDPLTLLKKEEKNRIPIVSQWEIFYSLDPIFVLKRAELILKPPETIQLELTGNTIFATGLASQDWIDTFGRLAPTLPGINDYNGEKISNLDLEKLKIALGELTGIRIYFENNSTQFARDQENQLRQVFRIIRNIQEMPVKINTAVQIAIFGHTDSSGDKKTNLRLGKKRAEKIFAYLIDLGINPAFLTIAGSGTRSLLKEEIKAEDRQFNRAVTFKPFYPLSEKAVSK